MWSSDADNATAAAERSSSSSSYSHIATLPPSSPPASLRPRRHHHRRKKSSAGAATSIAPPPLADETEHELEMEVEDAWREAQAWPGRHDQPRPVLVLAGDDGAVGRSRSLTDDDLEELKGCADLGFGFSYDEIPELRDTLPALELCYSMSQRLLDDDQPAPDDTATAPVPVAPPPVSNWKISSPGDSPDEVKARLKYWAQAVACTVRLCS